MMNRRHLRRVAAALALAALLCGCAGPAEEPIVSASADGVVLPCAATVGEASGEDYPFVGIVAALRGGEIPYVAPGAGVTLEYRGESLPPEGALLEDYVLTADGSVKYWSPEPVTVEYRHSGGVVEFYLPDNFMTMLSSNSADYQPGASVRGFLMRYGEGEGAVELAFVLRTDPGIIFATQNARGRPHK